MQIIPRLLTAVTLAITTSSALAVTYIVPTDRDLVNRSEAIVIATAIGSHSEITADGRVVTIATMALEEVLKGELRGQASIDLIEPGGVVGDRVTLISGSPRYTAGKHYLVFLRSTSDGWATYGFGLGQFEYVTDPFGHQVFTRGGVSEGIFGWDESWRCASRGETARRDGVRDVRQDDSRQLGLASPGELQLQIGDDAVQRSSDFAPRPAVSVPGGLDGVGAITAATANWTGAGAGVHYGVGVANPNATGGLSSSDHISAVLFNDPAGIIPPGVAAAGGVSDVSGGFTTEVDVVVGKNFQYQSGNVQCPHDSRDGPHAGSPPLE